MIGEGPPPTVEPPGPWDLAPCGYLITADDGTVLEANRTAAQTLGRSRAELLGMRFVELLPAGARMYHETHFVPMLRMHGAVSELALDLRSAAGERVPVLINARRHGAAGETHIVTFDARQRRDYERELLAAKQRAEASELRATALSRTLQATLIPPLPPAIPGLDVATAYRPAGLGDEVGGDFYDIFQIARDEWVVTIGDVEGKGVHAAAVTALARHVLRAASVRSASPREALWTLNDVLLGADTTRLLTAIAIRLTKADDGWQAVFAAGGHTAPLVVRAGRPPGPLGSTGTILGVMQQPPLTEHRTMLRNGDLMLLTTDGVHEAKRPGTDDYYGEERVATLVGAHRSSAHDVAQSLLEDVLDFSAGATRDDIAIVAIRVEQARTQAS